MMVVRTNDVLEILDRVLRKDDELGEAYLFAVDIIDAIDDGAARLEDPRMVEPLRELAKSRTVTHAIVEELRTRLGAGKDGGTA